MREGKRLLDGICVCCCFLQQQENKSPGRHTDAVVEGGRLVCSRLDDLPRCLWPGPSLTRLSS